MLTAQQEELVSPPVQTHLRWPFKIWTRTRKGLHHTCLRIEILANKHFHIGLFPWTKHMAEHQRNSVLIHYTESFLPGSPDSVKLNLCWLAKAALHSFVSSKRPMFHVSNRYLLIFYTDPLSSLHLPVWSMTSCGICLTFYEVAGTLNTLWIQKNICRFLISSQRWMWFHCLHL